MIKVTTGNQLGKFSDFVVPNSFTVLNQPDYIFLCGGGLNDFDHSLRAHFQRDKVLPNADLHARVLLAEKADEWYQSRKLFVDLLELEEYLAGLSVCVLLFVESPGAIAEFGAFSQMKLIKDKLVVVIEDSHFGQTSFIRNGLIEHVRRLRQDSVLSYPWFESGSHRIDSAGCADTLDEVENEVRAILKKRTRTSSFDKDDHGHRMLLIADLVSLSVVMLQQELQELIVSMMIDIKPNELKKYLFLLNQLELIRTFHYGNVDYYIAATGKPDYIEYAPKTPADRSRLRALLRGDFGLTSRKNKALSAFQRKAMVTP